MAWGLEEQLRDFQRFVELTRLAGAVQPAPDAVVWPETMFPGRALNSAAVRAEKELGLHYSTEPSPLAPQGRVDAWRFHDDLLRLQKELGVPMLVGAVAIEGDYANHMRRSIEEGRKPAPQRRPIPGLIRRFNSVLLIHKGAVREDRYDKMELTPFGEIIPYLWRWPDAQQRVLALGAEGMTFDLSMGARARGLDIPLVGHGRMQTVRAATPICFEATKADLCRRLIIGDGTGRAALFINLSNDGWFSFWDPGRRQHLQAARWRCVEMGVPMVRAVNTGISVAIDRRGRVVNDRLIDRPAPPSLGGAARIDGVLVAQVRVDSDRSPTVFERVGMVPAYGVFVLSVLGTAVFWVRRRRLGIGS
jgi:apolipoprotein N-acyltransferase